jgi:hypothetical protein
MPRPSPLRPCRRAFPCSPPLIALRNAHPRCTELTASFEGPPSKVKQTSTRFAAISENDRGCVKTLKAVVGTQQEKRSCGLGESFRARAAVHSNQSCAETTRRMVFTQPRPKADSSAFSLPGHFRPQHRGRPHSPSAQSLHQTPPPFERFLINGDTLDLAGSAGSLLSTRYSGRSRAVLVAALAFRPSCGSPLRQIW